MRYKNVAPKNCDYQEWEPVGLESFCIFPRMVSEELSDKLPDPFQIVDTFFKLYVPAGELSLRSVLVDPKLITFVEVPFIKARMFFIDNFGEKIDVIEWIPATQANKNLEASASEDIIGSFRLA